MATYNYNVSARYTLVGRIMKSTSVVAYVINDRVNGQIYPLGKGVVEQLALNKQIYNSYAQVYGGVVIMKGIGCKISELPKCNEKCEPLEKVSNKNTDHISKIKAADGCNRKHPHIQPWFLFFIYFIHTD